MKAMIKKYKQTLKNLGFTLATDGSLYPKRQEGNPLQISTITQKKINGLLENTGLVIDPTNQEHRAKHFQGMKPIKYFNTLAEETYTSLYSNIAEQFCKEFTATVKFKVVMHKNTDIPTLYNMRADQENDNGKQTFLSSGVSCMQGKPKRYFEIYAKTQDLQIATLEDEQGNLYGRALVWADKHNRNKKVKKQYYIDRIYIADVLCGSDTLKATYQAQMYNEIRKQTKCEVLNCYSISHIRPLIGELSECEVNSTPPRDFQPILEVEASEIESFPYCDTFQGIDGKLYFSDADGDCEVSCTTTDGHNANDDSVECEECNHRMREDDSIYSEVDCETLCEDCAIFL